VNDIFEKFSESKADKPFLEFHDKNIEERSKLTLALEKNAREKGLYHAIQISLDDLEHKKLNPSLVQSAFAIFLTHNKEAQKQGVIVPPLARYAKFKRTKKPLANPVTPDTLRGMDIIAYWREDYDLNDHHNHWHQVYPTSGIPDDQCGGVKRTIKRQGELFLYMHSQMLARYNAELLAWDLDVVHPFGYDDVLTSGYLPPPGLQHKYSSRPAYRGWFEDHNPDIHESPAPPKEDLITWRSNIYKAMKDGFFLTEGGDKYVVDECNMMNTVGVVLEAEGRALQEVEPGVFLDRSVYGNLHNQGHNKFAEIGYTSSDPNYGVMGDVQTAVRDPVFWMWHKHIDDFRQEIVKKYTHSLETYKPDAEIVSIILEPRNSDTKTPRGGVATYICPPNLEFNEVHAKLGHEPYEWKVTVKSTLCTPPTCKNPQNFTVRLFIVPEVLIQDQRSWIEMDKFTCQLTQEQDTIVRKDIESSVARQVRSFSSDSRCNCGWPQNLMLPAGKPEGMRYTILAMLTNDQLDKVCESIIILISHLSIL
jgi:hypothetical protein